MSIPSIKSQLLQEIQRSLTSGLRIQDMAAPPPAYTYQPVNLQATAQIEDEGAEHDVDATHSPINMKFSCPITVIGDANLIAINPSQVASNIASCIICSIKECSMARAGIPMIDEEGRPRPIDVQVDAGITVHGTKNTIGNSVDLFDLRAAQHMKRKRESTEDYEEQPKVEGNGVKEGQIDEGNKKQKVI